VSGILLDSTLLAGYLQGREGAVSLIDPWLDDGLVRVNTISYGEVIEHYLLQPEFERRKQDLRRLVEAFAPIPLSNEILERYATIRRQLRRPYGPGITGDIDSLIAATVLENDLAIVTTDSDFIRVPELVVNLREPKTFAPRQP
jgi:predicted nucleic acid-binding protein